MSMALFNGCLGVALSFGCGLKILNLSIGEILLCIFGSQLGGFIALFATLRAEKVAFLRRHVINRSLKTWALFLFLYLGTTIAISPALREVRTFLWMIVPLMLGNGLMIVIFGPIQDRWVRADQRVAAKPQ